MRLWLLLLACPALIVLTSSCALLSPPTETPTPRPSPTLVTARTPVPTATPTPRPGLPRAEEETRILETVAKAISKASSSDFEVVDTVFVSGVRFLNDPYAQVNDPKIVGLPTPGPLLAEVFGRVRFRLAKVSDEDMSVRIRVTHEADGSWSMDPVGPRFKQVEKSVTAQDDRASKELNMDVLPKLTFTVHKIGVSSQPAFVFVQWSVRDETTPALSGQQWNIVRRDGEPLFQLAGGFATDYRQLRLATDRPQPLEMKSGETVRGYTVFVAAPGTKSSSFVLLAPFTGTFGDITISIALDDV